MLKVFPKENVVTKAAKVLLRWGIGVLLTALGFQAIYTLLLTEFEGL